jgi:hypothetical protein
MVDGEFWHGGSLLEWGDIYFCSWLGIIFIDGLHADGFRICAWLCRRGRCAASLVLPKQ